MKLVSVYRVKEAPSLLYQMLRVRPPEASISHRELPSFQQHRRFVRSMPYSAWYLIKVGNDFIGAIYLTRADEIGIFVFADYQGMGHAPEAIRLLLRKHPRARYLANVNPANGKSIRLFRRLGFTLLQHTYEHRP
jgi:RimJ/RimL family protein N-acetyltransferase